MKVTHVTFTQQLYWKAATDKVLVKLATYDASHSQNGVGTRVAESPS